jgi:hypothetical protein
MLKIELNVKRQNDQEQREQFTFYFSKKFLQKSIQSLKSWKCSIFILFDFLVRTVRTVFFFFNKYFCLVLNCLNVYFSTYNDVFKGLF